MRAPARARPARSADRPSSRWAVAQAPAGSVGLWTRRGGVDCIAEVGRLDPLRGGIVIAAFDMGRHQPFVVWCQQELGKGDAVCEVLGCNVYSVLEFDA